MLFIASLGMNSFLAMATTALIVGTSSNGSLDEAVGDAMLKMVEFAGGFGADLLVEGRLLSVKASAGGIAGQKVVTVEFVSEVDV
jgi:hypothetical protein